MEGAEGCYRVRGQEKKAGGGGGGDFIVEELLDFSNEEEEEEEEGGGVAEGGEGNNSAESSTVTAVESCNSSFSGGDLAVVASGDLCEPLQYDELAELEWLSNFVEDSFSSEDLQKLQLISGVKSSGPGALSSSSDTRLSSSAAAAKLTAQQPAPFFLPEATAVPGKARSKRSRATPCNWASRLLVLPPTAAASSSAESESVLLNPPHPPAKRAAKPAAKRKEAGGLMAAPDGRKCLHCATDKTPQWRTGPMGPKTLCNACGVRYKSGRLVPEYRPAASPTFVLSKHSNSHRKVLELRRQKEMQHPPPPPQSQFVHPAVFDSGATAAADDFLIHHRLGPDFRQLI